MILQRLKSNTYRVAAFISIVIAPLEVNFHLLRDALGDNYGYAFIGFSIVMMVMRELTTKSIQDK